MGISVLWTGHLKHALKQRLNNTTSRDLNVKCNPLVKFTLFFLSQHRQNMALNSCSAVTKQEAQTSNWGRQYVVGVSCSFFLCRLPLFPFAINNSHLIKPKPAYLEE